MGGETGDGGVAESNQLLEDRANSYQTLEGLTMKGIRIAESRKGFLRCHFVVSNLITVSSDPDGNWEIGAMATLIDAVGVTAVYSLIRHLKGSVELSISVLSTAKAQEEMEIEAKIVGGRGRLVSVVIEVRRRSNGELIALGKQWVAKATAGVWLR
ncbi:unnamed protein product [Linum tenue]|uniref:Thioesterase domain-containing protein n=1 Tax=Linum tenue TaxID=586396 RepID=A0AAV0KQJ2_9ROSI|nr:unnamed protein product [Linum tenue]